MSNHVLDGTVSALERMFRESPAETKALACAALVVGVVGLVMGAWQLYRAIERGRQVAAWREPKEGNVAALLEDTFAQAVLGTVMDRRQGLVTALSPDRVWEMIQDRLESQSAPRRQLQRFLAYLPLLLGLAGTLLGLSEFAQDGAATARGTERLASIAEVRATPVLHPERLQGVYLGSLCGIAGSILAGVGTILIGYSEKRIGTAVEAYAHDKVLPLLPPHRVQIEIHSDIAKAIQGHISSVMAEFGNGLKEIAAGLEGASSSAAESSQAAAAAATDLGGLVKNGRQVRDAAVVFAKTASGLGNTAHVLEATANRLGSVIGEVSSRSSSIGGAADRLGESLGRLVDVQNKSVSHLSQFDRTASELGGAVADLKGEVRAMGNSFAMLAADIEEKAKLDKGASQRLADTADRSTTALEAMAAACDGWSRKLEACEAALQGIGGNAAKSFGTELERSIDAVKEAVADGLSSVNEPLRHGATVLREAFDSIEQNIKSNGYSVKASMQDASGNAAAIKGSMEGVAEVLDRAAERINALDVSPAWLEKLNAELQELNKTASSLAHSAKSWTLAASKPDSRDGDEKSGTRWWGLFGRNKERDGGRSN